MYNHHIVAEENLAPIDTEQLSPTNLQCFDHPKTGEGFFSINHETGQVHMSPCPINPLQDAQVLQVAAQGEQVPSSSWNLRRNQIGVISW